MLSKCYSEVLTFPSFEERFEYLKIGGIVGEQTFGYDRWINQMFYKSPEWLHMRSYIIARDLGCDLAMYGFEISRFAIVHHITPITKDDVLSHNPLILDPENLILMSDPTHKAIHYGDISLITFKPIERRPNDTCPWR